MTGFTGFIASWYLMFLTGAIFGKVMEDSGAADSVSKWIVGKIGMKRAALADCYRLCSFNLWRSKLVRCSILGLSNGLSLFRAS